MIDLDLLGNLADILGALTIVGGVVFAVGQLRELRAQRREAIAVELVRSFHDPTLTRATSLIRGLQDDVDADELRALGAEYEQAAVMVCHTFESIAILVFRNMASFSMVRDLTGGLTVVMWRKLRAWLETIRSEQAQPSYAEWFQWLAEQLERERDSKEGNPAYRKHQNWQPSD